MQSRILFLVVCLLFFTLMVMPFESNGHSVERYRILLSDKNPILRRVGAEGLIGASKDQVDTALPLLL